MPPLQFDPESIRSLALVLRDAGLSELELVDGDSRIRLSRSTCGSLPAAPEPAATGPIAAARGQPAPAAPAAADEPDPAGTVSSPMVGIAYLSPDPASPPFVTLGASVTAGQTVLMIEAMKTFNQIKAPRAGTVTRLLVANGQPVEYGQALLVIA